MARKRCEPASWIIFLSSCLALGESNGFEVETDKELVEFTKVNSTIRLSKIIPENAWAASIPQNRARQ